MNFYNKLPLLLLSIIFVLVSDISDSSGLPFYLAQGFILISITTTLFIPLKRSVITLVLITLAGSDIVEPGIVKSSIWQVNISFIRPSWIVFLILFGLLARARRIRFPWEIKGAAFWLLIVPIITSLAYGGFFTNHVQKEVIDDIKFPLMILLSTVLFYTLLKDHPGLGKNLIEALFIILFVRHFMDFIYIILNVGPELSSLISRGSVDSAKSCINLIIFYSLINIKYSRKKIFWSIIFVIYLYTSLRYGTRMIWITFVLGIIVYLSLFDFRGKFRIAVISVIFFIISIQIYKVISPDTYIHIENRANTVLKGRDPAKFAVDVDPSVLSAIDPIRYAEVLNINNYLVNKYALLWGVGFGGFYTDEVVNFPLDLKSSFPDYSLMTGRYYTAHSFPYYILLKFGLIGLLITCLLWLGPAKKLFQIIKNGSLVKKLNQEQFDMQTITILLFVFTSMLALYWSGKGLFISGLIISLTHYCLKEHQKIIKKDA